MKSICIIGGGISGLSCLHYLSKKFESADAQITLIEKDIHPGGTAQTIRENDAIIELGPNGFLSSNPATLHLAEELGLKSELVQARADAKNRFIVHNGKLMKVPVTPPDFLKSGLFNPLEKITFFFEMFKKAQTQKQESVYAFTERRFGKKFADLFAVPMVKGIFAGDARAISLEAAFSKIKQAELDEGSLIRYALKQKRTKPTLYSFKLGMGQLIDVLYNKYTGRIRLGVEALSLEKSGDVFIIKTNKEEIRAHYIIICTPAFAASQLSEDLYPQLSKALSGFQYAPVTVLSLLIKSSQLQQKPDGFGFLYPDSVENKDILGVLFESDIFSGRCQNGKHILRVMMRPSPAEGRESCLNKALFELNNLFSTSITPEKVFFHQWPKAIPQYDLNYSLRKATVERLLQNTPGLYLSSNYFNGVSFNECVEHARELAQNLNATAQLTYSLRL